MLKKACTLYIEWTRSRVSEYDRVTRCHNCLGFGHTPYTQIARRYYDGRQHRSRRIGIRPNHSKSLRSWTSFFGCKPRHRRFDERSVIRPGLTRRATLLLLAVRELLRSLKKRIFPHTTDIRHQQPATAAVTTTVWKWGPNVGVMSTYPAYRAVVTEKRARNITEIISDCRRHSAAYVTHAQSFI